MRTSAGFFVTGFCGDTRIQSFPLRFKGREMVTRAASICWPVIGPRVSDCRPNSPKASVLPRLALPAREPFIALRYLVRAGARAMEYFSYVKCFRRSPTQLLSDSFLQIQHLTPILP